MNVFPDVPRCDETAAWKRLEDLFRSEVQAFDLREAFESSPDRFNRLSFQVGELLIDLSKNWLDHSTLQALVALARECQLETQRRAFLEGQPVNLTEGRAALHTALRNPDPSGNRLSREVASALDAMLSFAEQTRAEGRIRHVVNIGIGGSDLGPQLAVAALAARSEVPIQFHFVSNLDGHEIHRVLEGLRPQETLFIVASKSFTTQDTLSNARIARDWFLTHGGQDLAAHFVATTANVAAATAFGLRTTFSFWDWVGGRYSLWSAIGLPIAIAIGPEGFRQMLNGAREMDQHFSSAPLETNLPVLLGLLDIWYRNFHGLTSRCVAPYHQGLGRLPAYLQQLEMESNGKGVDLRGQTLPFATSPVIWGEPGTNGQHAFFQMLHQGHDVIPVEFILVKTPTHKASEAHAQLLANGLAQAQALMLGKTTDEALQEPRPTSAASNIDPATLARHRTFPGNRPSTTIVMDGLSPRSLGQLVALYEHRVFVTGALWGINSFDQWGVELGKSLASQLLPRLLSGDTTGLDSSTAGLLKHLRAT